MFVEQVTGGGGSICAPSCEVWRKQAKFGEAWRTWKPSILQKPLTFTRVLAKVPHLHQSSDEGGFSMWVVCGMVQVWHGLLPKPVLLVAAIDSQGKF